MKIAVTQECIASGRRRDSRRCPVARAIRMATGERNVRIIGFTAYLAAYYFVGRSAYRLPKNVGNIIRKYDAGAPMEPFSFELPV